MYLNISAVSHSGIIREKNEDNLYFNDFILENIDEIFYLNKKNININVPVLTAVFDGMGGISNGEKASFIAAKTAKEFYKTQINRFTCNPIKAMAYLCKCANENICTEMLNGTRKRMGSTASMICFNDKKYYLCNIGDSPILMYRDSELSEISFEHTEKQNHQKISHDLAANKKYRLTQHLGIFPEEMEIEPYLAMGNLQNKDKFIICSDGLTDMVRFDEIKAILNDERSIDKTVDQLLNAALNHGGRDNITIIGIEVKKRLFDL